jgi:hypothetical protein
VSNFDTARLGRGAVELAPLLQEPEVEGVVSTDHAA